MRACVQSMHHDREFLSLCSTWPPRQFSLHIFYLVLSPLVYLAEKGLSPSTSKWLRSFVQYSTIQISRAHSLGWQARFVRPSITVEWAHKNNNHISIAIWRSGSCHYLFALNYQQLNSFCLVYICGIKHLWDLTISIHTWVSSAWENLISW